MHKQTLKYFLVTGTNGCKGSRKLNSSHHENMAYNIVFVSLKSNQEKQMCVRF